MNDEEYRRGNVIDLMFLELGYIESATKRGTEFEGDVHLDDGQRSTLETRTVEEKAALRSATASSDRLWPKVVNFVVVPCRITNYFYQETRAYIAGGFTNYQTNN